MKFLNKIDSAEQLIQDENHRLVSDVEKTKWNTVESKETPSGAQAKATKALTDAKTYVNGKVKTDVPSNAKFTDTVYNDNNNLFASGGPVEDVPPQTTVVDADTLGGRPAADYVKSSQVLTNVPSGAIFTDTIVDISGKADLAYVNTEINKRATKAEFDEHKADGVTQEKIQEKKSFGRLIVDGSEFVHWYGLTDINISDDTLVKSGTKSVAVKTNTENTTSCVRYRDANLNLSNVNNLILRVNLNNYGIYVKLTIRFYTDTKTYYQYEKTKWELAPLWNDILIPIDNMQIIGTGGTDLSNVQHIDFLATGQDGGSVILDSIYINHNDKAKVILQFDDADASVFNTAYPMMKKRGIVGSLGVISDMVGSGGYLNLEQLKHLYSIGWDMFNHSKSHLELVGLTPEELDTELRICSDYLVNNGIGIASNFVAYPFGLYNEQILDYMDKNYKFGRTVYSGKEIKPSISKYTLKCIELNHSVEDTVYQNIISELENSGGTCIFLLHKVADSPLDSSTYTIAQFEAFIDYLIGSDVEVINTSEWMYL